MAAPIMLSLARADAACASAKRPSASASAANQKCSGPHAKRVRSVRSCRSYSARARLKPGRSPRSTVMRWAVGRTTIEPTDPRNPQSSRSIPASSSTRAEPCRTCALAVRAVSRSSVAPRRRAIASASSAKGSHSSGLRTKETTMRGRPKTGEGPGWATAPGYSTAGVAGESRRLPSLAPRPHQALAPEQIAHRMASPDDPLVAGLSADAVALTKLRHDVQNETDALLHG